MLQKQDAAAFLNLDPDGFELDPRDVDESFFFGIPQAVIQRAEERLCDPSTRSVAYFSMEFGLAPKRHRFFHHSFISLAVVPRPVT